MARVNVDDRAHGDPRFRVLGLFLGCPEPFAHDFALGLMTLLWRECIERGAYELPEWIVNAIMKTPKATQGVLKSDLGETGSEGYIRIKGTRGRVEYLERKRAAGRQFGHLGASHGAKGGRPKKTPSEGLKKPGMGVTKNPPPAPAPSESESSPGSVVLPKTEIDPTFPTAGKARGGARVNPVRMTWEALFDLFWPKYPRKVDKQDARKAWRSLTPKTANAIEPLARGIATVLQDRISVEWRGRSNDTIPYPATFLRGEEFTPVHEASHA